MEDTVAMCRGKSPRVAVSSKVSGILESAGYSRISSGSLPAQDAVSYAIYQKSASIPK
jgi:hypothetical protein